MKPCSIIDCYGENRLDLGIDPSQNGRMAVILDLCHNVLSREYMNHTVRAAYGGSL